METLTDMSERLYKFLLDTSGNSCSRGLSNLTYLSVLRIFGIKTLTNERLLKD